MLILTVLVYILFLTQKYECNEPGCQFFQHSILKPNQLWWTHDGRRLPPVFFSLDDHLQTFAIRKGFDLTAAGEGWSQMLVSPKTDTLWIQQLCLSSYDTLNFKRDTSLRKSYIQRQALFNGLTAFNGDDWCSQNLISRNSEEISTEHENVFVHLIHYSLKCERTVYHKHNKFIVQLDIPNSRPVYQCIYFQSVDKNNPEKVINVLQSKDVSLHLDESLCNDDAEYDSFLWIPSLSKNTRIQFTPCPFPGGFQITSMDRIDSEKPICDYQTFATLESECVTNEGVEWTFDDPKCNIFEVSSISHHKCYSFWKTDGLTYTLLLQDRKDDGYSLFTMIFSDIPDPLNPSDSNYGQHKPIWIYPGLLSKGYRRNLTLWNENKSDFDTRIPDSWDDQKGYEITAYQLHIRRAFGICDDEPTSCTKGCDYDIRNRMFCYKSCPVDDRKCKSSQWDSCTFKQNYQGHWNFIEPMSNMKHALTESYKPKWTSLIFGENYLIFMGKINVSYLCIREVREAIQDWFIIRSRKQANGCQPRDVCLELFQSGIRRSFDTRNTNTMEFRISQSRKYGSDVRTLCSFDTQSFSLNSKPAESSTALILVRNLEPYQMSNPYSDPPVKCGLYQMRLVGTMSINANYLTSRWKLNGVFPLLKNFIELSQTLDNNSNYAQSVNTHGTESNKIEFGYLEPHINHNKKSVIEETDLMDTQNLFHTKRVRNSVLCHIELSDFNRTHGTTGEFGNKIWIYSDCLHKQIRSAFNTSHICLSGYDILPVEFGEKRRQLILITYHVPTKIYFCWIFKEVNRDNFQSYLVFLFDTPQCQYHRLPSGDIQVNKDEAIAQLSLTPVACNKCGRKPDQKRKQYSINVESRRSNVLRIQTNQMKHRQTQRALRQSIQTSPKNISFRKRLDSFSLPISACLSLLFILL
ncbi:unnamed protein product [Heterobilharzia americana]|nr:unnamed protein product [Heterobilharzia americana]